jgi:hypothetical protein
MSWRRCALTVASSAVLLGGAASPALARTKTPTLRLGSHGAAVRTLQSDLTKVRIRTAADGYFYRVTRRHVIRFQRREHLGGDGIVGPRTWHALQGAVKQASQATAAVAAPTSAVGAAPQLALNAQGLVNIPAGIPSNIAAMLQAANQIAKTPYVYGGGHGSWATPLKGSDCSGSVSYVLHAAGLMDAANGDPFDETFDSEEFAEYGAAGASASGWATLWVHAATHVYLQVSNLYFDTGGLDSSAADRWTTFRASPASGFKQRHPVGF